MDKFFQLLISFSKVGIFGFGGGPSFIPLIQEEVVDRHKWLTQDEFVDALAMGNTLPGPIATKMSTYVGYKIAGIPGIIAGALGTVLPSMIFMLILASLFWEYKDKAFVQSMLKGIRPAVVAMLAVVIFEIFSPSIKSWGTGLIAIVCFAMIAFLNVHPAFTILLSALIGILVF